MSECLLLLYPRMGSPGGGVGGAQGEALSLAGALVVMLWALWAVWLPAARPCWGCL